MSGKASMMTSHSFMTESRELPLKNPSQSVMVEREAVIFGSDIVNYKKAINKLKKNKETDA